MNLEFETLNHDPYNPITFYLSKTMFDNLTLQQFCALDYHRNMVVTAGPGAGKTRILSHRFCFLLLTNDSVSLSQILTLTFTEKAAEEMKARIYLMLNDLERELQDCQDHALYERIRDAKEQFYKNRISTIHSFCAILLREHPVESGIDPGFMVVQGARQRSLMNLAVEEGVSAIWQESRENLLPLLQTFGGHRNLIAAIKNIIEHPLAYKRVCETARRLFNTDGWEQQVLMEYCRHIADYYLVPYLNGLLSFEKKSNEYEQLLSIFEEWHKSLVHDPEFLGVPALFRDLRRMASIKKPYSAGFSVYEGLRRISYVDLVKEFYPDIFFKNQPDRILGEQIGLFIYAASVCMERYRSEKEKINALDFSDLEAMCHTFLTNLCEERESHKLEKIRQRFRYVMVDEFQDTNRIQWDIISMLCSEDRGDCDTALKPGKLFVVGDKRQAIYGFRGGDVTVFESVIQKIKGSNPFAPEPMFWMKEDVNEQIGAVYSAYPEYLDNHLKTFAQTNEKDKHDILNGDIYLPHNFRTDPRPIAFFNNVFNDIFGNKGSEQLFEYETAPREIIGAKEKIIPDSKQGSVSFYLIPTLTKRKDQAEAEASLIVDTIERIMGKQGTKNYEYMNFPEIREKIEKKELAVGVLFSTFTYLKTFEYILREAGLSFKVHRGKGFYRCQEVMEMVQLLHYISDERQNISLLSALRSPIFGVTDREIYELFKGKSVTPELLMASQNSYLKKIGSQIQRWMLLSCRLTLSELIRTIISERSLTAIYTAHPNGVQRMANIEKLINIARRFQAEGNGSLPEFSAYCLEMANEEEKEGEALIISGGESSIWLMTIHAAKGLEFPMVIIPDLDRRLPTRQVIGKPVRLYSSNRSGEKIWNSQEGELPVWQVEIPELDFMKRMTPLGFLLKRRELLENMAENRRVFYVACTRAENHLVLLGSMKKGLMENKMRPLSSNDYREKASILELLNDIYDFNNQFPYDQSEIYEGADAAVIWKNPDPKGFKGISYRENKVTGDSFGRYDEKHRNIDLTGAIGSPFYSQFSFNSIRQYKKCPISFYFNVILGIKGNVGSFSRRSEITTLSDEADVYKRDDDEGYGSLKALLLGNVMHEYMERYSFGEKLDMDLFNYLWEGVVTKDQGSKLLGEDILERIKKKALKHLDNVVNDTLLAKMISNGSDYAEIPFLFRVSGECEFRGVIDRLFKDASTGQWVILDWKSNDLKGREPADIANENGYNLQLACYRWAVGRILNEKVDDLYIYFTDKGHLHRSTCLDDPEDIVAGMLEKAKEYGNNKKRWLEDINEIKKTSEYCVYCDYRDILCSNFKNNS